tara:strand:+ start:95 stop:475 length:381 start_codon:yes stop_codon:yes gene_type:complete
MGINKDYLRKVLRNVREDGHTELEIQKRYFSRLNKELKGEDRTHLRIIKRKIDELGMEVPLTDLLAKRTKTKNEDQNSIGLQNNRDEGDVTEWIIERDEGGNLFKRKIGSEKKVYIKRKIITERKN